MERAETSTLFTLGTPLPKGCLEEIIVLAILPLATSDAKSGSAQNV